MDIIITEITAVRKDTLFYGSPYISKTPREENSVAFIIDGALEYTAGGEAFTVHKNEILIIEAGHKDITRSLTPSVTYYFFNFKTLVPLCFDELTPHCGKVTGGAVFEQKFRLLLNDYACAYPYSAIKSLENAYSILFQLVYELSQGNEYCLKYSRIERAVFTIETGFSDCSLHVNGLAEKCGISVSTLNRLFAELLNISPAQYLKKKRMENACYLIRHGTDRICELAEKCGYKDIYTFSRAFKNTYGYAPSKFSSV